MSEAIGVALNPGDRIQIIDVSSRRYVDMVFGMVLGPLEYARPAGEMPARSATLAIGNVAVQGGMGWYIKNATPAPLLSDEDQAAAICDRPWYRLPPQQESIIGRISTDLFAGEAAVCDRLAAHGIDITAPEHYAMVPLGFVSRAHIAISCSVVGCRVTQLSGDSKRASTIVHVPEGIYYEVQKASNRRQWWYDRIHGVFR